MPKTFSQSLFFAAPPAKLFALYADSKLHSESTGSSASIQPKAGTAFTAGDDYISGVNIHVEKNRLLVQTWRGSDWKEEDPDSIFILLFLPEKDGTRLHVTHANIPDDQFEGIKSGWTEYYWKPWKDWLKKQATAGK